MLKNLYSSFTRPPLVIEEDAIAGGLDTIVDALG